MSEPLARYVLWERHEFELGAARRGGVGLLLLWTACSAGEGVNSGSSAHVAAAPLPEYTYGFSNRVFPKVTGVSGSQIAKARLVLPNELSTQQDRGFRESKGRVPEGLFAPSTNVSTTQRIVTHVVVPDANGEPQIVAGVDGSPVAIIDNYSEPGCTSFSFNQPLDVKLIDRRIFIPQGALSTGSISPALLSGSTDPSSAIAPLPPAREFYDLNGLTMATFWYQESSIDVFGPTRPHRRLLFIGTPGACSNAIRHQFEQRLSGSENS